MRDLNTIRVLYRQPDTMALYGIPYEMRRDVRQEPRHLIAGNGGSIPGDWIWLGSPGWYGSMTADEVAAVKLWLLVIGETPDWPGEWLELAPAEPDRV